MPALHQSHAARRGITARLEFDLLTKNLVALLESASKRALPARPLAGGITRLGKFEALAAESRFECRPECEIRAWLVDSLRLRIRQNKYTMAAIVLPMPAGLRDRSDATIEIRCPHRGWVEHWRVSLKQKRPGSFSIGEPVRLQNHEPATLAF